MKDSTIGSISKLEGAIELFLEHACRINEAKPQKYWYPLSIATYGVKEILQALDSLCHFRTSMWEKTFEFEARFAQYQNSNSAVMVNSGSSADLLMAFLLTNPLKPILARGDEVLIPVVTWPTHIWSVMMAGLKVKLVDVDPTTLNIDMEDLERSISPKTRAIFPVHLMGNPCDMKKIVSLAEKHGLIILEDCCEAFGSQYGGKMVGNFGLASSFSFFFSHHMMTMEGGMISCNNEEVADHLRILRAHGWMRNVNTLKFPHDNCDVDERYKFVGWGFNVRPTDLQAGFGICQLEKLPSFNKTRELLARKFFELLKTNEFINFPRVETEAEPSWFALPMMVAENAPYSRSELTDYLERQGVETRPIVTGNVARHPVASIFPEFSEREFPGADQIHSRGFYVGLSPLFTEEMVHRLADLINGFSAGAE